MLLIRSFRFVLLGVFVLGLTACGGGGEDGLSDGIDDPSETAPTVLVYNYTGTPVDSIWVYEAYTGHRWEIPIGGGGVGPYPISGLVASQYDFGLFLTNGGRSDDADADILDPYNGEWFVRTLPRANPGEEAHIYFY